MHNAFGQLTSYGNKRINLSSKHPSPQTDRCVCDHDRMYPEFISGKASVRMAYNSGSINEQNMTSSCLSFRLECTHRRPFADIGHVLFRKLKTESSAEPKQSFLNKVSWHSRGPPARPPVLDASIPTPRRTCTPTPKMWGRGGGNFFFDR